MSTTTNQTENVEVRSIKATITATSESAELDMRIVAPNGGAATLLSVVNGTFEKVGLPAVKADENGNLPTQVAVVEPGSSRPVMKNKADDTVPAGSQVYVEKRVTNG